MELVQLRHLNWCFLISTLVGSCAQWGVLLVIGATSVLSTLERLTLGYIRVSTEEQTFGASLENQRIAIQKRVRSRP